MSSGFISESEILEARRRRQEEWDKVRTEEQPKEAPEEAYDSRPLFTRLEEQRLKKEAEYEEAHKLKNMIRGLDDDEVGFLDLVERTKAEVAQQISIEEKKEMQEFRNCTENETAKPLKMFEKNTSEKITSLFKKRKIDDVSFKSGKRCKKPTTCHQCGKHFNSQSACMKHHLEQHPGTSFCPPNERHICEICGASLAPGSVAVHKNMHTREKIFACETCGRQFYESVGLKRHMLTHTGEKPFACTSCDKRFTQSASLKLHYRTFHLKQPYPKRNRRKKD